MTKETISAYLTLCKPRVVLLMLVTTWVGMILATPHTIQWSWVTAVAGTIGIALTASCGAVINHWVDRKLDAKMARTLKRPLPTGRVAPRHAAYFSMILGGLGLLTLILFVNPLTAGLTFMSLVGYAGLYTVYLKPKTPQNIVIGGLAGAMPPLLGWVAVTNHIHPDALLLVLIIFTWTPPHFWALAIYRYKDYATMNIPMLPVTHGIPFTKRCIVLYTLLMIAATGLPFASGMQGLFYLTGAALANIGFLFYALRLYSSNQAYWGLRTFHYSIAYLFILFGLMIIDHWL